MGTHKAFSAPTFRRFERASQPTSAVPGDFTLLFICTGNICRSPLAERLLRRSFDEFAPKLADRVLIHSAGLATLDGAPMDSTAARQLSKRGGDSSGFSSRQLTRAIALESDLILTMTGDQRIDLVKRFPQLLKRTFLLREFARISSELSVDRIVPSTRSEYLILIDDAMRRRPAGANKGLSEDVPDPYRQSEAAHEEVARLIAESVTALGRNLFSLGGVSS